MADEGQICSVASVHKNDTMRHFEEEKKQFILWKPSLMETDTLSLGKDKGSDDGKKHFSALGFKGEPIICFG